MSTTAMSRPWSIRGWRRAPCGAAAVDLDRPWRELEYCVIDVETTGLDLRRDEVVSFGAVIVRDGRVVASSSRYRLVRPPCAIKESAIAVHVLRAADLAAAPPLSDCVPEIVELLSGRIMVAHAVWIEQAFLGRALRDAGWRLTGPVLDTAALARGLDLTTAVAAGREPSLEGLAMRLKLPVHTPHHALGDAMTTAQLLLVLATLLPGGRPTARELVSLSHRHTRR